MSEDLKATVAAMMSEVRADLERLVSIVHMFEDQGILLKGVDVGLIDFPTVRSNGEEVYLCYKAGERRIRYWHTLTGGYAGRRPLDEL